MIFGCIYLFCFGALMPAIFCTHLLRCIEPVPLVFRLFFVVYFLLLLYAAIDPAFSDLLISE